MVQREVGGAVDAAARQESQAQVFLHEVARAVRDACWYLRDNLQALLANHWDHLRDLAYEGSTDFIPALHHLGLPSVDADTSKLTGALTREAHAFQKSLPKKQEEAAKDVPAEATGDKQEAEQAQQVFEEEEGQKQAV
jgi:hypothetical protein